MRLLLIAVGIAVSSVAVPAVCLDWGVPKVVAGILQAAYILGMVGLVLRWEAQR